VTSMTESYKLAAAYLSERIALEPHVGIICGSGLSGLSAALTETQVFKYEEIPGFPCTTVAGHAGELVFGLLSGVPTVCMRGRFHFYEGHDMQTLVMPVRVMRCLGVKVVVVTNAAGGINPKFNVGDVMCMTDHFSLPCLAGFHPLRGSNDNALGPRFVPTSNTYDEGLKDHVVQAAKDLSFDFVRPGGCYMMVSGPTYESKTEGMFVKQLGADCVGMSTVPEAIAAHHCGMKVIGLSLITNKVILPGEEGAAANHEEVLEEVGKRSNQVQALIKKVVGAMKDDLAKMDPLPKIRLNGTLNQEGKRQSALMCVVGTLVVIASLSFWTRRS